MTSYKHLLQAMNDHQSAIDTYTRIFHAYRTACELQNAHTTAEVIIDPEPLLHGACVTLDRAMARVIETEAHMRQTHADTDW